MQVGEPCSIVGDSWASEDPRPVATWYDDSQQRFIALLERRRMAPPPTLSDLVECRILARDDDNDDIKSSVVVKPGLLLRFRLPPSLAIEEHQVVGASPGESLLSRRLPLSTRLSLDHKLLAIQFSSTLLRIIPLQADKSSKQQHHHWTIDLSTSGEPMPSAEHTVPLPRYKVHESVSAKDSHILPGCGIIWSDHGGNSQDLVVVTTKSVLCYKISLRRNQMAATHSFRHPQASAVWWEPTTRAIVVGSYGPANECQNVREVDKNLSNGTSCLQLRTFLLRFPRKGKSKRLPRFELPPPRRLAPFAVGISTRRLSNYSLGRADPLVTPADVWLVNLYGDAYMVEVDWDTTTGLQFVFHRLDPSLGGICFKSYTIVELCPTNKDVDTMILSVLDNVLCVSLRGTRKNIFMDIADEESYYFLDELDENIADIESPHLSVVPPSLLLDPSGRGNVFPLALDIEKLATTLPSSTALPPFFLRRTSPRSHEIALSKLDDILRLGSARQRRQSIESVVRFYAMEESSLARDWRSTMPLIYQCAFLPLGAELRHHHADIDATVSSHAPRITRSCASSSLSQKEILEVVLLPTAKKALTSTCCESDLHLVLGIAIGLLGALDRQDCPPCPALECFIFALLWRLGCTQEIGAFLQSRGLPLSYGDRSRKHHRQKEMSECAQVPPAVVNSGTLVLVNMMIAITQEVDFGCDDSRKIRVKHQKGEKMRKLVLSETTRLLTSRLSDVKLLVRHLLSRGRLEDAMTMCSTHVLSSIDAKGGILDESHRDLASSKQSIDGESFFRAAMATCRLHDDSPDRWCRLLYCLNSFLSRWDPDCMTVKRQRQSLASCWFAKGLDDASWECNLQKSGKCRQYIQRRPSSRCLLVMTKRQDEQSLGVVPTSIAHQSPLGSKFEADLDQLFLGQDAELSRHTRQMFGFAVGGSQDCMAVYNRSPVE